MTAFIIREMAVRGKYYTVAKVCESFPSSWDASSCTAPYSPFGWWHAGFPCADHPTKSASAESKSLAYGFLFCLLLFLVCMENSTQYPHISVLICIIESVAWLNRRKWPNSLATFIGTRPWRGKSTSFMVACVSVRKDSISGW
jgi:hypothetical protein